MNWNWPDNKRIALLLSFDIDAETLWLTLDRAYELYQTDKSNVSGRIGSNGKNAWRRT